MERHVALPADAASICSHSESSCGPPRLSPRYGSSHSFLLPVELLDRWEAQLAAPGKETRGETVKAASDSWHPRPPCPGHRWHRPDVASPPDKAMGVLLQREGNKIMNTPPPPRPGLWRASVRGRQCRSREEKSLYGLLADSPLGVLCKVFSAALR